MATDEDLPFFPLFVDDWLGGTLTMTTVMKGAYISALIGQWKSREIQAIKDDPKILRSVCGCAMPPEVRAKFTPIEIDGVRHLRNARLATVYAERKATREKAKEAGQAGAKARWRNPPTIPDANGGSSAPANAVAIADASSKGNADANGASNGMGDSSGHSSTDSSAIASQSPYPKEGITKSANLNGNSPVESEGKIASAAPKKPAKPRPRDLLFEALAAVCRIDWEICTDEQRGELNQSTGILRKEKHTPEEIVAFGEWWFLSDWRGKKGQSPTPSQVRELWKNAFVKPSEPKRGYVSCG